jgi:hypothetical protein
MEISHPWWIANAPNDKGCGILDELILLATLFKVDLTTNSITQVDLAIHEIVKCRGVGIYDANCAERNHQDPMSVFATHDIRRPEDPKRCRLSGNTEGRPNGQMLTLKVGHECLCP